MRIVFNIFNSRPVETGRGWGLGASAPQIFAKVDLLQIENDSDKKKSSKKT